MTPSKRLHGLMKGQRLLPFTAGERLYQKGVGTKPRFLLKGAFIDPEIEPATFVSTELPASLCRWRLFGLTSTSTFVGS